MKNFTMWFTSIVMLFSSVSTFAKGGYSIIGEVSTSNKNIEFTTTDGSTGNKVTFAPDIISLDYAGTVVYGDVYARYKISQTLKDDKAIQNSIITMERSDQDLTIGQFLSAGVSLFIGYKTGEFQAVVAEDTAATNPTMRVKFVDEGGFAGIGYSTTVGKGALSISLAYADMDGEMTIKTSTGDVQGTTGETTGTSVSINWSTQISESTNFILGLNTTRYDMEDKDLGIGGLDFSTEQKFDSVSLGLSHYF